MVFPIGMNPDGKNQGQNAKEHQNIRTERQQSGVIAHQQILLAEIQDKDQGRCHHRQQQEGSLGPVSGGDVRVKAGKEDQGNPEQPDHHPSGHIVGNPEAGVNGHHPDGNCGFVEKFITAAQGDKRIECGCCNWQEDLTPHDKRIPGPFQTGKHNAGHCRSHHAQRHQPGQHIFTADIKMCSCFHTPIIYQKATAQARKKAGKKPAFLIGCQNGCSSDW